MRRPHPISSAMFSTDCLSSIRLATNLYTDQLLDHHHYLDWVTTSLENSSQARLPLWMLVTQIYLSDLMRSRRFARRIVLAILRHLDIVSHIHSILIYVGAHIVSDSERSRPRYPRTSV